MCLIFHKKKSWSVVTFTSTNNMNTQSSFRLSGEKSCAVWSTAGPVVQRGSSFQVYCTFKCKCKGSMYSDHPPTLQSHKKYNSTTIYLNAVNITKNRTYSCQCTCPAALDPCGLDISAGCECDTKEQWSISHWNIYPAEKFLYAQIYAPQMKMTSL